MLVRNKEIEKKIKKMGNIKICYAPRGNLSKSRNIGIKKAKYDPVLLLDSDVRLSRNYVNIMLANIKQHLVLKSNIHFEHNGGVSKVIAMSRKIGHVEEPYTPGILLRKEVFRKIGYFNERIPFAEDGEFISRFKGADISYKRVKKACLYHPAYTIKKDLKMTYKLGKGKRSGVELAGLDNNEDFIPFFKRLLCGEPFKYFIFISRQWGLDVAIYEILWYIVYYIGYYVQRFTKR